MFQKFGGYLKGADNTTLNKDIYSGLYKIHIFAA